MALPAPDSGKGGDEILTLHCTDRELESGWASTTSEADGSTSLIILDDVVVSVDSCSLLVARISLLGVDVSSALVIAIDIGRFAKINYSTTATCTECRGKTDCMSCST